MSAKYMPATEDISDDELLRATQEIEKQENENEQLIDNDELIEATQQVEYLYRSGIEDDFTDVSTFFF